MKNNKKTITSTHTTTQTYIIKTNHGFEDCRYYNDEYKHKQTTKEKAKAEAGDQIGTESRSPPEGNGSLCSHFALRP